MVILNFNSSKKEAFKHGFIKGLAAPYLIYGNFTCEKLPEIMAVNPLASLPKEAMGKNFGFIQADLNSALVKYGKTHKK